MTDLYDLPWRQALEAMYAEQEHEMQVMAALAGGFPERMAMQIPDSGPGRTIRDTLSYSYVLLPA